MSDLLFTASDNPCWGGPKPRQHNLEHLLNMLGENTAPITSHGEYSSFIERIHRKLVVFYDDNYLVINKPPDLRMDGDYAASVHKLLLYLFPPPSLRVSSVDDAPIQPNAISEQHTKLLQTIAPLPKHPSLKDDPFRIVHQLDYATSGVLLYAKNKSAASAACKSFQERRTNKEYVAVVVNPNMDVTDSPLDSNFIQTLPALPSSCLSQWNDGSLENRYRKKRKRDTSDREAKKNTFNGFMPVHSVFAKWRASLLALKKKEEDEGNDRQLRKPRKKRPNDNLPPLPEPETPLTEEEIDEILSFGPSWKTLKSSKEKHSRCWITIVELMAKKYNQSLSQFYANKEEEIAQFETAETDAKRNSRSKLPPIFRLEAEDADAAMSQMSFYICASIGEPKGDRFDVVVDPSIAKPPMLKKNNDDNEKHISLDMKPSLTKCTVLWRGSMKVEDDIDATIPVTKVLLQPWTGRRHQLRVHLAHVAGFPILGDVTYGGNIKTKSSATSKCGDNSLEDTRVACRRMCLHAKRLSIPLIDNKKQIFEAPDPFRIAEEIGCTQEHLEVLL